MNRHCITTTARNSPAHNARTNTPAMPAPISCIDPAPDPAHHSYRATCRSATQAYQHAAQCAASRCITARGGCCSKHRHRGAKARAARSGAAGSNLVGPTQKATQRHRHRHRQRTAARRWRRPGGSPSGSCTRCRVSARHAAPRLACSRAARSGAAGSRPVGTTQTATQRHRQRHRQLAAVLTP
jgi:hypothetical protein